MAILHPVGNTDSSDCVGDVVFVHGLDGGWRETWSHGATSEFWPAWVAEAHPSVAVWSVEYEGASSGWRGNSMSIFDRGTNVLDALLANRIGQRPVIFVTHSMGGLIAKQMLRSASSASPHSPRHARFVESTRGIIFLATPHTGSDLAGLARFFGGVLRVSEATVDLSANASNLRDLNMWYRNQAGTLGISSKVYFESRNTSGVRIVDSVSSDPGIPGIDVVPIDSDHVSICKLSDKRDQIYLGAIEMIENLIVGQARVLTVVSIPELSTILDENVSKAIFKRNSRGEFVLFEIIIDDE